MASHGLPAVALGSLVLCSLYSSDDSRGVLSVIEDLLLLQCSVVYAGEALLCMTCDQGRSFRSDIAAAAEIRVLDTTSVTRGM